MDSVNTTRPETIPPFEHFYREHRDEVFRALRRSLPRDAEDAFQETFLRALHAYPRLAHGDNLRAWVHTIARNVAIDLHRRRVLTEEPPEIVTYDAPTPLDELSPLTDSLPHTERVAVVLRYGYDLPYDRIAAVLGSSSDAARQATSAGVRRLRRQQKETC